MLAGRSGGGIGIEGQIDGEHSIFTSIGSNLLSIFSGFC